MPKRKPYRNRIEMLQGTLGLEHGYGINQSIRAGSGEVLQVETGSLYRRSIVLSARAGSSPEWGTTSNNQRAKYDQLSPGGRKQLAEEQNRGHQMTAAIANLMAPQQSEGQA